MNWRRLWILAVLASSGCLSVPPFGDGVGFRPDDGGGTIIGKDFSLHFGGGAFKFPDRLEIGGTNVLATRTTCSDEDGAGIAIAPGFVASPNSTSTGSSTLTTILNGPAAVQVKVAWTGSFMCQGSDTANGSSTFTVFPNGRIVRFDEVDVGVQASSDTPACVCAQDDNFFVTSFFNFSTDAFSTLISDQPTASLPAPGDQGIAAGTSLCIDGFGPRIALAYNNPTTRLRSHDTGAFALVFDLLPSNTTLTSTPPTTQTMALRASADGTSCTDLAAQLTDSHVTFDDNMVSSDDNGIYDAPTAAQENTMMIGAEDTTQPGIAVTVKFPGAKDISVSVPSFHQHNDSDDTFTIWFPDPIGIVTVTGT